MRWRARSAFDRQRTASSGHGPVLSHSGGKMSEPWSCWPIQQGMCVGAPKPFDNDQACKVVPYTPLGLQCYERIRGVRGVLRSPFCFRRPTAPMPHHSIWTRSTHFSVNILLPPIHNSCCQCSSNLK
jgi:hypothetical protein